MMILVERESPAQNAPLGLSLGQVNTPVVELYVTWALAVAAAAARKSAVYCILIEFGGWLRELVNESGLDEVTVADETIVE